MRRYGEIILVTTLILFSIFLRITLIGPLVAYGQGKGKNPFSLPPGVYLLTKSDAPSVKKEKAPKLEAKLPEYHPPPLEVKAILISDHVRLASIDQQIVTIGDAIHGERILEIEADRVILGRGDKRRTLFLPQSPLLLTVEEK